MLFNSLQFLLFFPVVVLLYWVLPYRFRNALLLVASYYFYMNWEPVYALLIFFSTLTTWGGALLIGRSEGRASKLAFVSTLVINLGILFVYKYLGFVGDEIKHFIDAAGLGIEIPHFEFLLPVGISFYTFQAVGYTVDVWRRTILPEKNLATYALFVSFFPQLVAGPIERAKNLLPQFQVRHLFNGSSMIKGFELMTLGYFMKLCIADNVAPYVDAVFNNLVYHNGNSILLASVFFTFQIFCDFGGYSLIAIGVARCMGFRLMQNFRQPYLACSVKDFWRRWHISLSSWFSDYVYIPLGGNRVSTGRHFSNLFVTFLLSGIWHGANYTFVAWGAYHGVLQCVNAAHRKWGRFKASPENRLIKVVNIIVTFILMVIGWIFFRANNIDDAFTALRKIATERGMLFNGDGKPAILLPLVLIVLLMVYEIYKERSMPKGKDIDPYLQSPHRPALLRSALFTGVLIIIIMLTARFAGGQFIYFQF